ncbi:MmgE/PrpD family protein [Paracoccus sediminicola]|uniref:MmgE/PrpD family protein n=1 Tax=Paracoccus sediminicola TaxID=3017783 RepID=UPI0022F138B5|nr:MmgE/PrpD family protein [Paracoccus sediminicola]WBU56265.1 MmgE/PrpD family protein [Paracoccus sediminicola]
MTSGMSIAERLADFAAAAPRFDDTMERFVRFSLFDWATVGIAGRDEPVARAVRKMALENAVLSSGATLFGGGSVTAAAAALANGATSHALDYDDTHFGHIGHPSVAVIPAAVSLAEIGRTDGQAFIHSVAIGLETACRVGAWLGRAHYDAGFHQTGTSGAFGATAAAGRILGLDTDRMAEAFSLTATRAAGLKSQFGTMGKPLNAGFAAEVGVTCALLAQAGAISTRSAIEGVQGFGPTHAAEANQAAFDGLGENWIFPSISYKFHACCHGLHAMLEALRRLIAEGLPVDAVEQAEIRTNPRWLAVCDQPEPATGLQAKFSYRLTAAMMLAGLDTAALDVYSDATCAREDLCALRDRISVTGDPELTDSQARITVIANGRSYEAFHDILADMDPDKVEQRLREKSATLLGAAPARELWQSVTELGPRKQLSGLIAKIASA